MAEESLRLARFAAVGAASWLAYTLLLAAVVENGGALLAGIALGFTGGTAVSFYGNCRWVFRAPPSAMAGGRFVVTTMAGLALNLALAALLTRWGVHYLLMSVIIFSVVPLFNYLGHRFWTFATPAAPRLR